MPGIAWRTASQPWAKKQAHGATNEKEKKRKVTCGIRAGAVGGTSNGAGESWRAGELELELGFPLRIELSRRLGTGGDGEGRRGGWDLGEE